MTDNSLQRAPVAVFAFNRPAKLAAMFSTLRLCKGFGETEITIFVDGPRNSQDVPAVDQVRKFVDGIKLPNVFSCVSEENIGLKRSVVAGITKLCKRSGRVIAFEDDLVMSPDILNYFNDSLDQYADIEQIHSICAYMPDVSGFEKLNDALVLPMAHPWGWATWQSAWEKFDADQLPDAPSLQAPSFKQRLNVHGLRNYKDMLTYAIDGKLDSWFLRWHYHICMRNGLSIFPPRSLVRNDGLDGGTHASRLNLFRHLYLPPRLGGFDFNLPADPVVDFWAIEKIARSREMQMTRATTLLGRVKRQFLNAVPEWK